MNHISSYKVFFMPLPQYNPSIVVLAGHSGSGKSALLQHLARQGYPVIDLEQLAQHSGSAFGHLPFGTSATSMGFLKSLKKKLEDYKYDPLVFTECKGNALGNAVLPEAFLAKLRSGYIVNLDVPFEVRLEYLVQTYAPVPVAAFIKAAQKLQGKLPPEKLRTVLTFLKAHAHKEAIRILLDYYDHSGAYQYFITHAQLTLPINKIDPQRMMEALTLALMEQHPLFLHCG